MRQNCKVEAICSVEEHPVIQEWLGSSWFGMEKGGMEMKAQDCWSQLLYGGAWATVLIAVSKPSFWIKIPEMKQMCGCDVLMGKEHKILCQLNREKREEKGSMAGTRLFVCCSCGQPKSLLGVCFAFCLQQIAGTQLYQPRPLPLDLFRACFVWGEFGDWAAACWLTSRPIKALPKLKEWACRYRPQSRAWPGWIRTLLKV